MAPIYGMAVVTTFVSVAVWYAAFRVMAERHRRLAWLMVLTLPLSFAVNAWVKKPLLLAVARAAGVGPRPGAPFWFLAFVLFLSPVTEEAIKVLPLLAGRVRAAVGERGTAFWAGLALGAGFGIGEIWFVARGVARSPELAGYPFWAYTGFLTERVIVVYAHAVMTAVLVTAAAAGRAGRGYLAAVGLHALLNLGALLGGAGLLDRNLAFFWIVLPIGVLTVLFTRMYRESLLGSPPRETVVFHRKPPPAAEEGG